jgi:hypothetical protein
MPRSEAFIQADVEERSRKLGQFRYADEPDAAPNQYPEELAAFIAAYKEEIRRYRVLDLANRQERPGRKAKGASEIAARAKALWKDLNKLPASERMAIAPLGLDTAGWTIDDHLLDLIKRAEARKKRLHRQATRLPHRDEDMMPAARSRRQNTQARDDFARGLKALAIGYLGKDESAAEEWVAQELRELKVKFPNPETRRADFKQMFVVPAPNVAPPPKPIEHGAGAELADDELVNLLKGITVGEYHRLTE